MRRTFDRSLLFGDLNGSWLSWGLLFLRRIEGLVGRLCRCRHDALDSALECRKGS